MLTKTPPDAISPSAGAARAKRPRDPRLDTFRGIGLAIILIAHIPGNAWALWIPARFGFSDATEIFVFLSGMASSIAFGRLFDREGFRLGTARIAHRVWQVYWAHIALFVAIAALMVAAGARPNGESYVESLNLQHFFGDPQPQLLGLLTLRYVPNYFDILPMYLVVLALIPPMLGLERINRALPFVAMAVLWGMTQAGLLDLPAEPWSNRPWFFNPLGWQLIFFLGFFLMRGTLPAPRFDRWSAAIAALVLIVTIPFAWYRVTEASAFFGEAARAIAPLTSKTHFGLLRLVHFLALAYLAAHAVGAGGSRLKGPLVRVVSQVGQQSLAIFITDMILAQALGILLDRIGRNGWTTALVNVAGLAVLIVTARAVAWFKSAPWKG